MTVANPNSPVVIPANGAAVALTPAGLNDPATFEVFNNGAKTIYWGDANVTSAIGVPITAASGRAFDLLSTDVIYGCTDGTGASEARVGQINR